MAAEPKSRDVIRERERERQWEKEKRKKKRRNTLSTLPGLLTVISEHL